MTRKDQLINEFNNFCKANKLSNLDSSEEIEEYLKSKSSLEFSTHELYLLTFINNLIKANKHLQLFNEKYAIDHKELFSKSIYYDLEKMENLEYKLFKKTLTDSKYDISSKIKEVSDIINKKKLSEYEKEIENEVIKIFILWKTIKNFIGKEGLNFCFELILLAQPEYEIKDAEKIKQLIVNEKDYKKFFNIFDSIVNLLRGIKKNKEINIGYHKFFKEVQMTINAQNKKTEQVQGKEQPPIEDVATEKRSEYNPGEHDNIDPAQELLQELISEYKKNSNARENLFKLIIYLYKHLSEKSYLDIMEEYKSKDLGGLFKELEENGELPEIKITNDNLKALYKKDQLSKIAANLPITIKEKLFPNQKRIWAYIRKHQSDSIKKLITEFADKNKIFCFEILPNTDLSDPSSLVTFLLLPIRQINNDLDNIINALKSLSETTLPTETPDIPNLELVNNITFKSNGLAVITLNYKLPSSIRDILNHTIEINNIGKGDYDSFLHKNTFLSKMEAQVKKIEIADFDDSQFLFLKDILYEGLKNDVGLELIKKRLIELCVEYDGAIINFIKNYLKGGLNLDIKNVLNPPVTSNEPISVKDYLKNYYKIDVDQNENYYYDIYVLHTLVYLIKNNKEKEITNIFKKNYVKFQEVAFNKYFPKGNKLNGKVMDFKTFDAVRKQENNKSLITDPGDLTIEEEYFFIKYFITYLLRFNLRELKRYIDVVDEGKRLFEHKDLFYEFMERDEEINILRILKKLN